LSAGETRLRDPIGYHPRIARADPEPSDSEQPAGPVSGSRRSTVWPAAALALLAASTVVLYAISRGKWSDPLIDSGNEWIVPDTIARGGLLYRDYVYWFGPFTPYFQAIFFILFGSSFRTLALADGAGAVGILAALYFALRTAVDRAHAAAWTCVAIPLLVFMPYSGGVLIGMGTRMWHAAGFGLLAGALSTRRRGTVSDLAAGAAVGLAGLCRTEWGGAALAGSGIAILLGSSRRDWAAVSRVAAFAAAVFAAGLGFFVLRAGPEAVLRDSPVLLYNLPPETRAAAAVPHPETWLRGFGQMAYAALAWAAVFAVIEILVRRKDAEFLRRRLPVPLLLLGATALAGALAGVPASVFLCAAPLVCAAALLLSLRMSRGPVAATLGGFGMLGVLTSYRRPFFIADGPYVGPPVLFAIVCAAGCLAVAISRRPPGVRERLGAATVAGVAALAFVLFVLRGVAYRADDRLPIPGTGGMLSARRDLLRDITAVAERLRRETAGGASLVVFPEGEVLNFLTDRSNPIRHKLYLPGYVSANNEAQILAELVRARPAAVVIWPRQLGEYDRDRFGADYARSISAWITREYRLENLGTNGRGPVVGFRRRS
jgi:hypothetical protein